MMPATKRMVVENGGEKMRDVIKEYIVQLQTNGVEGAYMDDGRYTETYSEYCDSFKPTND